VILFLLLFPPPYGKKEVIGSDEIEKKGRPLMGLGEGLKEGNWGRACIFFLHV
jgi:hypothetical protein